MATEVRFWRPDDADAILRTNAGAHPHVAALDRAELRRLASAGARIYVCDRSATPVAYAIVCPAAADYDGEEFHWFRNRRAAGFWYVDQVAIDVAARRSGLGREIYAHLAREAWASGARELCCEVNLRPENPDSLAFHRRLAFERVGELEVSDGRQVALLVRSLSAGLPTTSPGTDRRTR